MYVSNRVANTISQIDLQTLQLVDTYPVPGGPDCMEVSAGGKTLLRDLALGQEAHRDRLPRPTRWCGRSRSASRPTASGRWTTRLAESSCCARAGRRLRASGGRGLPPQRACDKPVYLTFDTGHMEVAPLVADVLNRQHVKVTFFAANEPTKTGDGSLGNPLGALVEGAGGRRATNSLRTPRITSIGAATCRATPPRFRVRASAGPDDGPRLHLDARRNTAKRSTSAAKRLHEITGKKPLPLFRAPGGKTSPALLAAAQGLRVRARGLVARRFPGRRAAQRNGQQPGAAEEGPARHAKRRHPGGPPGHLVAQGSLGAGGARAADRGPEGEGLLLFDLARSSGLSRLDCKGTLTMDWIEEAFSLSLQQWLFETLMQPAMFALGLGDLLEDGYAASGWLLVGLIQIAVLVAVIGPLQRWRPVEPVLDRATIRTDMLYTSSTGWACSGWRLFFLVDPLFDELFGMLRVAGFGTFHLDQLWPGVTDQALVSFAHLPGGVRFRGLLDPPGAARPQLVVEPALAAPRAAPDDDVER